MTITTFFLVVLAALLHASWNLLAKKSGGGAAFVILGNAVVMAVFTPIFLLWWWNSPSLVADISIKQWLAIAVSAAVHLVYSLTLQRGYQLADYGVVYPVARGTGPLLSSIAAIVFFGEAVNLFSGLGILAIVAGIFVLSGGLRMLKSSTERSRAGLRWGAATGLFIALYTALDGYSVKFLALSPLLLQYFSSCLRMVFMSPMFIRNRREVREEWRKNGKSRSASARSRRWPTSSCSTPCKPPPSATSRHCASYPCCLLRR